LLAFTFPGQGSQKPGMGAPWVDHPSWELVEIASEATGRDVKALLLDAQAEELTETRNAQLATFVLSLVILDAIERTGVAPAFAAGHSLGEYSALVASGSISFEDGCKLVRERGEGMQQAANDQPGTMYAVLGLEDEQVDVACRRADGDAWVANYNAPGQVVIAGEREALERAASAAKQLGAKRAVALPVGGAFHTPFMSSARSALRKALDSTKFQDPEIPLVANVDAMVHSVGSKWPDLCSAQLCSPVRWHQTINHIVSLGAKTLVEVGPGNVLTNLVKRINDQASAISVSTPNDLDKLMASIKDRATNVINLNEPTEGEHLYVNERLVVSTGNGLFTPVGPPEGAAFGQAIEVGDLIGKVGDIDIRTPFAGKLMGPLVIEGERVTSGQPVAWLRAESNDSK